MKTFQKHFDMLLEKLKNGEHFGYCRFSDGELRIMQNVELKLASDHNKIGEHIKSASYHLEDHKHFNPNEHQFFHNKLMESYRFKKNNYYVGLSCRCCVGDKDFQQMLNWYEGDINSDNLTWANLFLNGNYQQFLDRFIPELKNKKVVYIVNENADLSKLPFNIVKDFRVGRNCIINDYGLIDDVKKWIDDNGIENHIFLFSASSLSNFMIHQLFEYNDKNTYVDIGTTLNPYIGMKARRGYHKGNKKICVW
jgi:hypothetical protein